MSDDWGKMAWFYRTWNVVTRLLLRLHIIHCEYCNDTGDGCDCGASDIPYEVTGGAHQQWCMYYEGCSWCGREAE